VAIVGVVLAAAAVAMVAFVTTSVRAAVSDEAEIRARLVAAAPPRDVIEVGDPSEEFVQVIVDGVVVASSANANGLAMAAGTPLQLTDIGEVLFAEGPFAVFTLPGADGTTVVVGRNLDDVTEVRATVTRALALGVPVIMLVVGLVTWWIVGRALRPVEAIREEVESITAADLGRRVPEPPSADEIARLAATMNAMLARLDASHERQRRFVSDASHELRTPIASIRQHAEVASAHPETATVEDLAGVVAEDAARLETLAADLLLLARIDEGWHEAQAEVDVDDLVLQEAARVRDRGADIDTHGVSAARVHGSEASLRRLIANLLENAARHGGGSIVIGLRASEVGVLLTVDDEGPGIAPADRARARERFVRLDEARAGAGAGLGLAIADGVVRAHGGSLELVHAPSGGLRVEVRLPAAP
jgi:signal transduction histidine kinase